LTEILNDWETGPEAPAMVRRHVELVGPNAWNDIVRPLLNRAIDRLIVSGSFAAARPATRLDEELTGCDRAADRQRIDEAAAVREFAALAKQAPTRCARERSPAPTARGCRRRSGPGSRLRTYQLDLAGPIGLQERLIAPVAIVIDEGQEAEAVTNHAGFRFFTSVEAFKIDAHRDVLALEPTGV
jgi:hypothetical protein